MNKITEQEVVAWARDFLQQSEAEITADERKEQEKYALLIQNPQDKTMLSKMLDESCQIRDQKVLAERIKVLIDQYGVPKFFGNADAFLLKLYSAFGYWFDFVAVPIFKKRLRNDTAKIIINEKPNLLNKHLNQRKASQIGQNVNLLGEVVLGDNEANNRYEHYLEALKDPKINYISIKISGIYAQINPLNYAENKKELCLRIAKIYQQAINYQFVDFDGRAKPKFVNLDMEEYKDTELTLDVFTTVLSYPEFKNYYAGIVLQAYLPDAQHMQQQLLQFAKQRIANGGAPIKMRLVKGANLQMESIVSSLKAWEVPIYETKVEVDANHLRIMEIAMQPENATAVHIGVATHNFFSIAYAYLLSQQNGVEAFVTFEMLEGMANHLPRVMRKLGKQITLYTPVVNDENFLNAIAYLVRRLDENTGIDNFLSYSFGLQVDSKEWKFLLQQFNEAYALKDSIYSTARRKQNRTTGTPDKPANTDKTRFVNEPDTNFDLAANRLWADEIRKQWQKNETDTPYHIPVRIGNEHIETDEKMSFYDKNQGDKVEVCNISLSNKTQVESMLQLAIADASGWRKTTLAQRNDILHKVADNLSKKRGHLIGCMTAITGKTTFEGDVEVSEAIDFCRYYPISMAKFESLSTVEYTPKGIVMVIPPWNFPTAIPVGGVAAALAGGNTVILKPATVAYPIAWEFAQCFWDAGVPADALQLVCTRDRNALNALTAHPSIKHIIMTGGTDTAFRLLENNPTCPLSAETGGKNAIIVTASADRDHAIQNIVTSAFSNAGQKCSACSLLILDKNIYNDQDFKNKLRDAVESMQTGSAWNGASIVGPMVDNKNDKLLHALNYLEPGEEWLVAPVFLDDKGYMLRPTVKWGVKPGSFSFENELFAPMLSVVCMDNLEHGIALVNSSEYGLTSGLQSLDEREQKLWKNSIEAGNLYINRGITGAIVSRQPFGGMKRSAFGGGIKAGGPNYVSCFVEFSNKQRNMHSTQKINDKHIEKFSTLLSSEQKIIFGNAVASYENNYFGEFAIERDIHNILGEQNIFRYLALRNVCLRVNANDDLLRILLITAAARIAKTTLSISISPDFNQIESIKKIIETKQINIESEQQFIENMHKYERIRTCGTAPSIHVFEKAAQLGLHIAHAPVLYEGRLELLHYLKEQSVTYEYHRYGSITEVPE